MEKFTDVRTIVMAIIGVIGSFITNLLGGWDTALQALLIFMAVDYILGLIVAGVYKKSPKSETGGLDSRAGWKGIAKKVITLLMVLLGAQLDILLGVDYIRIGLIFALIFDESISIAESYGLTGRKIPGVLVNALDILRKKGETNVDSNR